MILKILYIVGAVTAFFLFLPLRVSVAFDCSGEEKKTVIRISWLGRLLGFIVENLQRCRVIYILFLRRQIRLLALKRRPIKEVREKEKNPPKLSFRKFRKIIKPTVVPFSKLLRRLLKAIELEHFALDAEYGTGNPASTGNIYGWCWALRPLLTERMKLSLRPNFKDTIFKGAISLELKVAVYYSLAAVVLFTAKFGLIWLRNK